MSFDRPYRSTTNGGGNSNNAAAAPLRFLTILTMGIGDRATSSASREQIGKKELCTARFSVFQIEMCQLPKYPNRLVILSPPEGMNPF